MGTSAYLSAHDDKLIAWAKEGRSAKYMAMELEYNGFPVTDFNEINNRLRYLGVERGKVKSEKTVNSGTVAKGKPGHLGMACTGNGYSHTSIRGSFCSARG